jgi:magnesium transporter
LIDFDERGLQEIQCPSSLALTQQARQHATRWANVYGASSPSDLATMGTAFGLHPLVQEDILNNAQRQKLDAYEDYLYLVLHRYEVQGNVLDLVQDQISLIIGRDYVLTFQERPSQTFEPIRQRLRNGHNSLRKGGVDMLAYSLIDTVVDSYFGVIEQLNDYAEKLEDEILGRPDPAALEGIHQLKRCVSHLRRNLHPLREVLGTLHRDAGDFSAPISNSTFATFTITPYTFSNLWKTCATWLPACSTCICRRSVTGSIWKFVH